MHNLLLWVTGLAKVTSKISLDDTKYVIIHVFTSYNLQLVFP